jgi:LysM repeat protein
MKTFKTLFLLTLFLLIFGSAGYFGYQLFIKPNRIERLEKAAKASAPAPTATPDQAKPAFDSLKSRQTSGITPAIRDEWAAWVAANTNSPLLPEGRRFLGSANMILLFQPSGPTDFTLPVYTVVKGDSLAKIASKQHSSAELIQHANQLPGIGLQIGQQLVIPQLKISLEIDRNAKTLSLFNNGAYLKEYPLLSCPAATQKSAAVTTRVLDKNAIAGTKRVAFGDKTYASAEKSILLAQAPAIVAAPAPAPTPAPSVTSTNGTNAPTVPAAAAVPPIPPMPGGFVLQQADLQEIFPLVSRNANVTIH